MNDAKLPEPEYDWLVIGSGSTTPATAVRALAYQTLGTCMADQPHTAQAAMPKRWAPQVATAAINDCVVLARPHRLV